MAGRLKWLLTKVHTDHTLSLDIRSARVINLYYRGASLMKITSRRDDYQIETDLGYFPRKTPPVELPASALDKDSCRIAIPIIKDAIDWYLSRAKKFEGEFQQLVQRENSFQPGMANSTDYLICDTEYKDGNSRFDLVGAYWPSKGSIRKKGHDLPLVLIEMKYGDAAFTGIAGIKKHIEDFGDFFEDQRKCRALAKEMTELAQQKQELGLLPAFKNPISITTDRCQVGLLLANTDPESKVLLQELQSIDPDLLARIPNGLRVFCPAGGGYGLFHDQVYGIDEFCKMHAGRTAVNLYLNEQFRQ